MIKDFENDPNLTERQKQKRRYYYAAREKNCEASRTWRINHLDKARENAAKWRKNNPERHRELNRLSAAKRRAEEPEKFRELKRTDAYRIAARSWRKNYDREYKEQAIGAYGGHCKCCGEDRIEFLSLDHVANDGKERRLSGEHLGGVMFYRQLRKQGFPDVGLQVLCMNCNIAKYWYGRCPHETLAAIVMKIPLPEAIRPLQPHRAKNEPDLEA